MCTLYVNLKNCTIYDSDEYPNELFSIYKTDTAYYVYNRRTLDIVFYMVLDKPITDTKNAPTFHNYYCITMCDIHYDKDTYAFSLYLNNTGYVIIHVNYNTKTGILTVEYNGTETYRPHGIQTYKNNIPKLDAQGKLKLALSETNAFTLLEDKVLREVT